jgi:hypothetical protein
MFVDWAKAQPVCIEILEIDVSKREDREARIDRPKYQCLSYRLPACRMQGPRLPMKPFEPAQAF